MIEDVIDNYLIKAKELLDDDYSVSYKSLKEGDKVIIKNYKNRSINLKVDTVKKITPTGQLSLLDSKQRFKNGMEMGQLYSFNSSVSYIVPYNAEAIELYYKAELLKKAWHIVEDNVKYLGEKEILDIAESICKKKSSCERRVM